MRTLSKLSMSRTLCAGLFVAATGPLHAALPNSVSAGDVTSDSVVLSEDDAMILLTVLLLMRRS